MFGLGGGLDPKKMKAMMKQMGINQDEVPASRVIIEKDDGKKIVIENPVVQKITMQGQTSFQISGDIREELLGISEDDVKLVMNKTGAAEDAVRKALEETNDIAEAIVKLS